MSAYTYTKQTKTLMIHSTYQGNLYGLNYHNYDRIKILIFDKDCKFNSEVSAN